MVEYLVDEGVEVYEEFKRIRTTKVSEAHMQTIYQHYF
jgi:hypothetical protein